MISYKYLLLIILLCIAFDNLQAQNAKIEWYGFSSGFAYSRSDNTFLKSSIGQALIGVSTSSSNTSIAGFFANSTLTPIVSVRDGDNDINIITNPNPASDYIEVAVPAEGASVDALQVRIYNMLGQCVVNYEISSTNNEAKAKIDVKHLPAGLYYIRIGGKGMPFIKN